jgi:hypothetical protein
MKTLLAIMYITGAIGYVATAFLAIRGYFLLRRQGTMLRSVYAIVAFLQLRAALVQIEEMEADLPRLIEREEFEAAKKMKEILEKHRENVHSSLDFYKKFFGSDATFSVEVIQPRPKGE